MKFSKGEIICREDLGYPEGALVCDAYDAAGGLMVHRLGGGLQMTIPAHDERRFRVVDEAERGRVLWRQARFSLGDSDELFTGWTDGQTWNGWAKPGFEMAEAERVIAWIGDDKARFDGDRDAFVTVSQDGEEEVWEARSIAISDGSSIKVYPIGGGSWCWDESEPERK